MDAFLNDMEFAQLLFDLGSQHLKDQWDNTPLDIVKRFGSKQMETLLQSHAYFGRFLSLF